MKKIRFAVIWLLPLILGTIGYMGEGYDLNGSLYASFSMYFMSSIFSERNVLIDIARWLAFLATASGCILIIKSIFTTIGNSLLCLRADSSAVYCEKEDKEILLKNLKNSFWEDKGVKCRAANQIFFYPDDMKNLNLYYEHRSQLGNRKVYIRLDELDPYLLEKSSLHFFNVAEIIARNYWRTYPLLNYGEETMHVKIAVIGFGKLGEKLLNYGLLNNIYTREQKIEYHVWGERDWNTGMYEKTDWGLGDFVKFHREDWSMEVETLKGFQRIIITEEDNLKALEAAIYTCPRAQVYHFGGGAAVKSELVAGGNVQEFGKMTEVLTEENIKGDRLYRLAKELNYQYEVKYNNSLLTGQEKEKDMEACWQKLDGFTKGSNIAAADYHEIRREILRMRGVRKIDFSGDGRREELLEELSEMEHIRWCRYHFLNHWHYGEPEDGGNKDRVNRLHRCLVPYEELTRQEQLKDLDNVRLLFELEPLE